MRVSKEIELEHTWESYMDFVTNVSMGLILIFSVFIGGYFLSGRGHMPIIMFDYFLMAIVLTYLIMGILGLGFELHFKQSLPNILKIYDNGWMLARHRGTWLAPAKLNWIYKVEFYTKGFEKKDKGKIWLNIYFTIPDERYKEYIFRYYLYGVDVDSSKKEKVEAIYSYLKEIAERNVRNGLGIPSGKPQKNFGSMQIPSYWNIVSAKINIEEMYRKETGEEPPKPKEGIEWWNWPAGK